MTTPIQAPRVQQINVHNQIFTIIDKNGDGVLKAEDGDDVFEGTDVNSSHWLTRLPLGIWNGHSVNSLENSLEEYVKENEAPLSLWRSFVQFIRTFLA